jgi:hypothetical protein
MYGHDLKREGVFHVLISVIDWHTDGGTHFFSLGSLSRDGAWEAPWTASRASSSASYSAWNAMRSLPTRSRLWEELILQTYRSENGPREAGDGEAARAVFNGSRDGVWQLSGSRDSSGGGGVGGRSSSKRWISAGSSGATARRQRRGSAMAARVQPNSHGIGHYL